MRVLLVDESVAIQKVAKLGLGSFPDAELKVCGTAAEVESTASGFQPEVVILSDTMVLDPIPREGGSARVINKLLQSKSNLIVLAASEENEALLRAQGHGAVLRKPFALSAFRDLVGATQALQNPQPLSQTQSQSRSPAVSDLFPLPTPAPLTAALARPVAAPVTASVSASASASRNAPKVTTVASAPSDASPEITIDLAALRQLPLQASQLSKGTSKGARVERATPLFTGSSLQTSIDESKNAPKATPSVSRPLNSQGLTPSEPVRGLESAVQRHVEAALNQNWSLLKSSLLSEVSAAILENVNTRLESERSSQVETIREELASLVRSETEVALRSWMGDFSRNVLKEVAREELRKLLDEATGP